MKRQHEAPNSINLNPEAQQSEVDYDGFMARMQALFAKNETVMNRIDQLIQQGPDARAELDTITDDLAFDLLSDNKEFNDNIKRIHSHRLASNEKKRLVARQKEIFKQTKDLVIETAGVPTEVMESDIEQARRRVFEAVGNSTDDLESDDVLTKLGILTHDDNGAEVFTYPYGIMPESTNERWEVYLGSVREHLKLSRDVRAGTRDRTELEEADNTRRLAHNRVARDVHTILGLEELSDAEWGFEKTRSLLAKMRDHRFPTVETAEKERTSDSVKVALGAVRALTMRLSDLHRD